MDISERVGAINFSLEPGLKPWEGDPDEYYVPVFGKIVVCTGDDANPDREATVGDLQLVVVKMCEAVNDRVILQQVCDAHSEELLEIYSAIFDAEGDAKEELRLECLPCDIVYLESVSLKPKYRSSALLLRVLETTIATFASQGLVVAHMNTLNQKHNEWSTCGFEVVPGTSIVFRDNVRLLPGRKLF